MGGLSAGLCCASLSNIRITAFQSYNCLLHHHLRSLKLGRGIRCHRGGFSHCVVLIVAMATVKAGRAPLFLIVCEFVLLHFVSRFTIRKRKDKYFTTCLDLLRASPSDKRCAVLLTQPPSLVSSLEPLSFAYLFCDFVFARPPSVTLPLLSQYPALNTCLSTFSSPLWVSLPPLPPLGSSSNVHTRLRSEHVKGERDTNLLTD